MTTEKRNDEIDLIEVFQKLGNGIVNLFNWFINLLYQILLFFIRRAILIGVVIFLLLAFGFYQYKTSPTYYSSNMEAYSNAMSSLDMIKYVNNINTLFEEDDFTALEAKLGIDSVDLEKIKNVKAYKLIDLNKDGIPDITDYDEDYETSDSTVLRSRFVVRVEVFDQSIFPNIEESILNYIEENKRINELNTIRKRQIRELIAKLNTEISSLDSLKKKEYFKTDEDIQTKEGQLLILNERPTQLYHPEIISLYKQVQGLESELELRTDAITIIQEFEIATVENTLFDTLKFYGILGIVFGILLAIFIENLKGVRKVISDSKKK